jgi:hypothetical protein
MLNNYLVIVCRNILLNKTNSTINMSGLTTGLSPVITVSFRSVKAAMANPAKSLQTE